MTKQQNRQYFLKGLLMVQAIGVLTYTIIAVKNDGGNFLERAQEFVFSLTWMGQFALDFSCYLILSALWIAWRNKFTASSILMAILASILGIIVFAPYLLFLIFKEKGDLTKIMVGNR